MIKCIIAKTWFSRRNIVDLWMWCKETIKIRMSSGWWLNCDPHDKRFAFVLRFAFTLVFWSRDISFATRSGPYRQSLLRLLGSARPKRCRPRCASVPIVAVLHPQEVPHPYAEHIITAFRYLRLLPDLSNRVQWIFQLNYSFPRWSLYECAHSDMARMLPKYCENVSRVNLQLLKTGHLEASKNSERMSRVVVRGHQVETTLGTATIQVPAIIFEHLSKRWRIFPESRNHFPVSFWKNGSCG